MKEKLEEWRKTHENEKWSNKTKPRKKNKKKVGKTTRIKEKISTKITKEKLQEWRETHENEKWSDRNKNTKEKS